MLKEAESKTAEMGDSFEKGEKAFREELNKIENMFWGLNHVVTSSYHSDFLLQILDIAADHCTLSQNHDIQQMTGQPELFHYKSIRAIRHHQ